MNTSLSPAQWWAFAALTVGLLALWAPRVTARPDAARWWVLPAVLAVVLAVVSGLMDARATLFTLGAALACLCARHATGEISLTLAHTALLTLVAGLFLHVLPGFDNPRVLDDVVLATDSTPYSKYLNFDKGLAALLLLGLYAPTRVAHNPVTHATSQLVWRFAVVLAAVLGSTVLLGYARWDPKLPDWWPLWLWSMVFLTALPEEALFRGVLQEALHRRLPGAPDPTLSAAVIAGLAFGLAHMAGGLSYVLLASVAGIGYGWIYARTGSLAAAALAHTGVNLVHLLGFSYPVLRSAGLE